MAPLHGACCFTLSFASFCTIYAEPTLEYNVGYKKKGYNIGFI